MTTPRRKHALRGMGASPMAHGRGARATVALIISSFVIGHSSFAQVPDRPRGAAATAGIGQERVTVDDKTEQTIRGALKYLASKQNSNGSWTASDGERQEVAMTGYVLITFLSCGHLPDEGEH